MKKSIFLLTLAASVALLFISCSPAESADPKTVLKTFSERLAKKDFDGAAELATSKSKPTLDMVKMGMQMAENMKVQLPENDPVALIKTAEFGEPVINGNTATITITSKANNQPASYDFLLVKENNQWKVDFSTETLTKMARSKFEDNGDIEGVNIDSIAKNIKPQDMERAKKMADSIMKNIDPKQLEGLRKQLENIKTPQ